MTSDLRGPLDTVEPEKTRQIGGRLATPTMLVDTDVHEGIKSRDELQQYLAPHWRQWRRVTSAPLEFSTPYSVPLHTSARQEWLLPDGTMGTDLAAMRNHLFDDESVTIGILNGFQHVSAMTASWDYAAALGSAYNDWQIAEWLEKEPRLRGSVHVVAQDPEQAAREIERVAEHPQIVQVFLPTVTDRQYGDPMHLPIFEAAVRNDLVVALHHGSHTRTVLGYPRYYVEWHALAAPQATISQLTSMICNGLFDRLPELKVVLLESGVAWLPWLIWRLDQRYKEDRREIPWVKRRPSEHIRDNVRLATQPMGDVTATQFAQLVELVETDRVYVFATDYPHFDADSAAVVLPGTLKDELRRRVAFQNALETYPRLRGLAD
jgi:uncharacterized protein